MLAIIPARGGSKGLPGKNIRPLCGKPLIEYTIAAAVQSKFITRIIISTDSDEIADIARSAGAEVPFLRPGELATDTAKAKDAYIYTCDKLMAEEGGNIDSVTILQPTSPLRTSADIDNAIELFKRTKADSVISVVESDHPIQWYKYIDEFGILRDCITGSFDNIDNRQAYSKTYLPNGAVYIFNYSFLKQTSQYYSEKTYPYIMPRDRSVDIDTLIDFQFAEFLLSQR